MKDSKAGGKIHAQQLMKEGYNWARSVLTSFAADYGWNWQETLRIAAAFGGGIARSGQMCGAVSGALMVIGLMSTGSPGREDKDEVYREAQFFLEQFRQQNGSYNCTDLLGCDLSTEQGRQQPLRRNLISRICPSLLTSAVAIWEELQAGRPEAETWSHA